MINTTFLNQLIKVAAAKAKSPDSSLHFVERNLGLANPKHTTKLKGLTKRDHQEILWDLEGHHNLYFPKEVHKNHKAATTPQYYKDLVDSHLKKRR